MHVRARKPLLDALTATRLKCSIAQAGTALQCNAEAHLRSRVRLANLYKPAWLAATLEMAARCTFSLNELRYEYPREIVPDDHTPASWLRHLTEAGAHERYASQAEKQGDESVDPLPPAVRQMVEHELALIAQLRYEPYFFDRGRPGALGAQPGHLVPGPGQRGQFGGVLLPGHHGGGPGAQHAAL